MVNIRDSVDATDGGGGGTLKLLERAEVFGFVVVEPAVEVVAVEDDVGDEAGG